MTRNKSSLGFENENTWLRAVRSRSEDEFQSRYEAAVEKVRREFGKRYPHHIGGVAVYSSEEFADVSPSDKDLALGYFQKGTREDARRAINAAKAAFPGWSDVYYEKRVDIFRKAAGIIRMAKFEFAALMSFENGKNRYEAIGEVDEAIDLISYYCHLMEVNKGYTKTMGKAFPGENTESVLKAYGVWGVIAPFNFPLAIAAGMSTGALITGNSIVFKPASDTPYMGLKLYETLTGAGLPNGVMNYVTGPGETVGTEIVENDDVDGIVFTGSKDVGFSSYTKFNERKPRPFIAEMGGKNPVIITAKADLDKAVEGVARAAFGFSGQKCSACSRVFVEKSVKDLFLNKLLQRVRELHVGDPTRKDTFLSPLINQRAYDNFKRYAELAKRDGKVLYGGRTLTEGSFSKGYHVEPTIVHGLTGSHELFSKELFVPILCVSETTSLEDAIKKANNVEYGLTAGIFSEDDKEVEEFFNRIEAGVVYANRKIGATTGAMTGAQPFVGWKASGSSGKGAGGEYYLLQFMREQSRSVYK